MGQNVKNVAPWKSVIFPFYLAKRLIFFQYRLNVAVIIFWIVGALNFKLMTLQYGYLDTKFLCVVYVDLDKTVAVSNPLTFLSDILQYIVLMNIYLI
jgi:hypothetical protein